ncbi:copper resistance protein CopC [Micromonospora sp. R77]|uniref:copper resistance CopC family protein n=1 Tax=Micromonospora sp. R77 TaxID=2925836 RepID=UPI001F61AFEC|nr:copper resistance CopC family protein [Micromonospora sp. R77]MCI4062009.1 copper resistance protein CopC [Micromonospora sp. R77]
MAIGVSLALPAVPAAAHNSLTGSDPKNGARLATAPKRIELRFLATPSPDTTRITVTGPDRATASGAPTFAGNRVSVPFVAGPPGVYTVAYQVGSTDGHPVRGQLTFTLTAGASATASPSAPATSPSSASVAPTSAPATSAAARPTPAASPTGDAGRTGWWWALGVVVLVVALGAGLLLRRRRR